MPSKIFTWSTGLDFYSSSLSQNDPLNTGTTHQVLAHLRLTYFILQEVMKYNYTGPLLIWLDWDESLYDISCRHKTSVWYFLLASLKLNQVCLNFRYLSKTKILGKLQQVFVPSLIDLCRLYFLNITQAQLLQPVT